MSNYASRYISGLKFSLNPSGYQFFTTTNTPLFMNVDKEYHGSGCFVAGLTRETPRFQAVASTLDIPSETDSWKLVDEPGLNNTDEAYNNVYNELLKIDNTNFIYHTTPDPYYLTETYAITDPEDIGNENTYKVKDILLKKSLADQVIAFVGSKCLLGITDLNFNETDPRYVTGQARKGLIPTITDYYNDGCLQKVVQSPYGSRLFVILSSVAGTFYAYPVSAPRIEGTDFIQSAYIQESTPNYPAWVFRSNWLQHVNEVGRIPLEPCYSWSYNSTGTRAQAVMLERSTLSETLWVLNHARGSLIVNPNARIYESNTNGPVLVDADRYAFLDASLDSEAVASDRFGWVELQLQIELTGPNLEDFIFSATVSSNEAPSNSAPIRVMAAYAKPLPWSNGIQVDDQIELYLTLRETAQQTKLREGHDGIHGCEAPQVGVWTFKVNGEIFLEFPEHLLRNEKVAGYEVLPYTSLYNLMTCDQYTSILYDVDLGSLSFHRKTIAHQVFVPQTPTGYTKISKRNGARLDTFIMGVLDQTTSAGDATALSFIPGYLESLTDLVAATVIFHPSFTYKFRGRYTSVTSSDQQIASLPPLWWQDVLWQPLIDICLESYYAKAGASEFGNKPATIMNIDSINESNFITEIMIPILNYDSSTIGWSHFEEENPPPDPWPCSAMLSNANSDFVESHWTNTNFNENRYAWLFYEAFKIFRSSLGNESYVLGDEYVRLRRAFTLASANDYFIYNCNEPWLYLDYSNNKTQSIEGIVKNYPWGHHWYARVYGLSLSISSKDKILFHPNGHYSYTHLLTPEYEGLMPFYETFYQDYGIPYGWSARFENVSATMDANLIKSKFVDRLCFKQVDGTYTETTHIDVYNEVFHRAETIDDYQLQEAQIIESNTGEFYFMTNRFRGIAERHNNYYFLFSHYTDETVPIQPYDPYAHSRNAPFFTK